MAKTTSGSQTTTRAEKTAHVTVLSVAISLEIINLLFSVDSVLASVAISPNPAIVLIGGIIGILAVRLLAEFMMKLMGEIPELEPMAYFLIAVIAVKMFLEIPAIGIEISAGVFATILLVIIIITIVIHRFRRQ